MSQKLTVLAFMIDSPGQVSRRRAMIKKTLPAEAPQTITIPPSVEQSQEAITAYLAADTNTPAEGITWRQPLRT